MEENALLMLIVAVALLLQLQESALVISQTVRDKLIVKDFMAIMFTLNISININNLFKIIQIIYKTVLNIILVFLHKIAFCQT